MPQDELLGGVGPDLLRLCHALLHPSTGSGRAAPVDCQEVMALLDESLAISRELDMGILLERVLARREILRAWGELGAGSFSRIISSHVCLSQ